MKVAFQTQPFSTVVKRGALVKVGDSTMSNSVSDLVFQWCKVAPRENRVEAQHLTGSNVALLHCCPSTVMRDLAISEESDPSQSWRFDLESNVALPFTICTPVYIEYLDRKTKLRQGHVLGSQPLTWSKVALHQR